MSNEFVIIPHSVLFNQSISDKAKLLYGLINSLCHKEGTCFATNSYLSDKLKCGKKYVSRLIKELEQYNLISVKNIYVDGKKCIDKRLIKINDTCPIFLGQGIPQKKDRVSQNFETGYPTELGEGIPQNWEDNNIILKEYIVEQDSTTQKDIVNDVITYLNDKTGKSYKASSQATQRHISARLAEGYKFEDFKRVIDNKCSDWLNDKQMQKYVRPETLFGTKFESYLNESSASRSSADEFKGYTKF